MPQIPRLVVGLLSVMIAGCGSQNNSAPNVVDPVVQKIDTFGAFTASRCFKNRAASDGMGQSIYTMATLVLNKDQSGETRFRLYSDADCQTELGSGTQPITYEVVADYDKVSVLRVHQYDENDSNNDFIFYLPISFVIDGAFVHIDGELADSGPYGSEPSEGDLSAFIHDTKSVGVFFSR